VTLEVCLRRIQLPTVATLFLTALTGCREAVGLADQVDFVVSRLAASAEQQRVEYRFTVTNRGSSTVWIPACAQRITPDIEFVLGNRTVDSSTGAVCLAVNDMSPLALSPGETYQGDRAVPYRTGVEYVPYLAVGSDRALATGVRLRAGAFTAQ
jgi:hypothetical protein